MFIHEAVRKAIDTTYTVRRKQRRDTGVKFILNNQTGICVKCKEPRLWNPTPNDLMADDWEVVE